MASAKDGSNPARENMKELRRFQELYVGRLNTNEAVAIMERFNYDAVAAADFVMTATNAEVMQLVEDEQASANLAKKFQNLRLPGSLLDNARIGRIDSTLRQFACQPCDNSWWRKTPERKQVSTCKWCHKRYDPVPREEEWGWAQFKCPQCEKDFRGHCAMTNTSPCFTCNIQVQPYCIKPPESQWRRGRRSNNTHKCDAADCGECAEQLQARAAAPRGGQAGARRGGRNMASRARRNGEPSVGGDMRNADPGDAEDYDRSQAAGVESAREGPPPSQPAPCVYPSSRRRKVIYASQPHDSSGSTVDTFLTQADFDDRASVTSSRMSPIREKKNEHNTK